MSDPAGWYPDPTARHELRYWDGYAWLDNVSDAGVAGGDPLGGKPMPAPSEAAAKPQQAPAAASKSKTPLYIGAAVVAVVVLVVAAVLVTRGDDSKGDKVTALGDQPITFTDSAPDAGHPPVHRVRLKANTVVIIETNSDASDVEPGVVIIASQTVVDSISAKIDGAQDVLNRQLRDACSNLREEDIGAKGTVVLSARRSGTAGSKLRDFIEVPVDAEYEFVPVLVDADQKCIAGSTSMTIESKPFDFGGINDVDELQSSESDAPELSEFFSS